MGRQDAALPNPVRYRKLIGCHGAPSDTHSLVLIPEDEDADDVERHSPLVQFFKHDFMIYTVKGLRCI